MLGERREVGGEVRGQERDLILLGEEEEGVVRDVEKPSTLVCPERQNTLAAASRATSATML